MRGLCALAALLLLAGCNADERGRAVKLGKGGYAGPPDSEIGDAARAALSARVMQQAGGGAGLGQALAPAALPTGAEVPVEGRIAGQKF